jgi:hypothetical protein
LGNQAKAQTSAQSSVQEETNDTETKTKEKEDSAETSVDDTTNDLSLTKAEKVGYDFIKAIQNDDLSTALSLVDIDTTFITVDDFSWYIPRSSYGNLLNTSYEIDDVYSSSSSNTSNSASYSVGKMDVDIDTILNNDNEWKVDFGSEYVSDYKIHVPSGVTIRLNNVPVSSDYITDINSEYDVYTIPALIEKDTSLIMISTVYGDCECTFLPSDGGTYTAVFEITGSTRDELYSQTMDVLNELYDLYESGVTDASDFSTFTSDKGKSDITTVVYNSVDAAHNHNDANTLASDITFTTFVAISKEEAEKDGTVACYLTSNDTVVLNCKVEKTWILNNINQYKNTRVYGTITIEKTDDGIKIADMPASKNILTSLNFYTKEWD